jgi:hypothetical protein
MKRINILSVMVALVVMITAVSCTTMTETQDDYYGRTGASRVYVDDPYRGTVVLERDPYSGRYYEVSPYGNYGTSRVYGSYGTYGGRYYNNNNSRNYNRNNNNRNYNNRNYRGQDTQRPAQEQRTDHQQSREEARKKILGN